MGASQQKTTSEQLSFLPSRTGYSTFYPKCRSQAGVDYGPNSPSCFNSLTALHFFSEAAGAAEPIVFPEKLSLDLQSTQNVGAHIRCFGIAAIMLGTLEVQVSLVLVRRITNEPTELPISCWCTLQISDAVRAAILRRWDHHLAIYRGTCSTTPSPSSSIESPALDQDGLLGPQVSTIYLCLASTVDDIHPAWHHT